MQVEATIRYGIGMVPLMQAASRCYVVRIVTLLDGAMHAAAITFRKALRQEGRQAQVSNFDFPAMPIDVNLHGSQVL